MPGSPKVRESKSVEQVARFWDPPEQFLLDAGREGELVIARIRVALTFALLLVPIFDTLSAQAEGRELHFIGFAVTGTACLLSIGIYALIRTDRRQRWIPLATSLFDVSFITITQLLYALLVDPLVLLNNRLSFDTYFLALGGTCLRFDKRVALVAGLAAMAQFIWSVVFVAHHFDLGVVGNETLYGRFMWSDQYSRLILLGTATALNVFVVGGIQQQRRLSNADALTGAFNRRFLDDYLRTELARASRYASALSVAMIDVDHFKAFNDQFGHAAGDRVLRQVAHALEDAVRRSDLVARYGGEEFVVVLPESNAEQAMARMERIRSAIASDSLMLEWNRTRGMATRVTVSIGVASWPDDGTTAADLLGAADRRLYQAKHSGRNRVVGPADVPNQAAS